MEISFSYYWLAYPLWGIVVGLLAGLLGVGGGLVTVPFLIYIHYFQGFPEDNSLKVVLGSSMATIMFTSFSSMLAHHKNGNVEWSVMRSLTPGLLIGSLSGGMLVSLISENIVAGVFIAFTFYTAMQMLLNIQFPTRRTLPGALRLAVWGWLIGAISAMISAGGGLMLVPLLNWCNVNIKKAMATSAACGFPIALFGTLAYIITGWRVDNLPSHSVGFVHLPSTFGIVITSFYFAKLGAKLSIKMPIKILKRIFALNLIIIGAIMINRFYF